VTKRRIAKLRQQGKSVRVIAKATGLSVGAVHKAISEAA
jgi:DNA-binding NarL/FixJ family response regulator